MTTNTSYLPAGQSARTLEGWVRSTSGVEQAVASYGSGATNQAFWFVMNSGGLNRLGFWTWGNDYSTSAPGLLDGSWHHVAVTYDGLYTFEIWTDGGQLSTKTFGSVLNTVIGSSGFFVGRSFNCACTFFSGGIDEVASYQGVLSPDRLRLHALGNPSWRYAYDGATRHLVTITDPDGRVLVTNAYDTAGRLTTQTDALGQATTFSYGSSTVTTTDPRGHATVTTYDSRSRLLDAEDAVGASTYRLTYTYDGCGSRSSVTDRNGNRTDYGYDPGCGGDLLTISEPQLDPQTPRFVTTFTHDARHNLLTQTDAQGAGTSWTYDPATNVPLSQTRELDATTSAVTTWQYADPANPGLATTLTITSHAYTLDGAGNRTALSEYVFGITTATTDSFGLTYDGLERLSAVTTTNPESFTLDGAGNITARTGPSATYTIDGSGRPTSDGVSALVWSAADRLVGRDVNWEATVPYAALIAEAASPTRRRARRRS